MKKEGLENIGVMRREMMGNGDFGLVGRDFGDVKGAREKLRKRKERMDY